MNLLIFLISRYNKKNRSHICAMSVCKLYNQKIMENDDEWPQKNIYISRHVSDVLFKK